jgi:hypothetical protein
LKEPTTEMTIHLIDSQLSSMLIKPEMWGEVESIEPQILNLLQIRSMLRDEKKDPCWILDHCKNMCKCASIPKDGKQVPFLNRLCLETVYIMDGGNLSDFKFPITDKENSSSGHYEMSGITGDLENDKC